MHGPLEPDGTMCIDGMWRDSESFRLPPADRYGFLLEAHEGQLSLHPARYDSSLPLVELEMHCGPLDACMRRLALDLVR